MYLVTTQQMQAAEKAADAAGLSYETMMENAGRAVAGAIEAAFGASGMRVLVLVGPGNNGGDGLVAARYLADAGASVAAYVWKRDVEGDKNWWLARERGVETVWFEEDAGRVRLARLIDGAAIIVDALLGTGVSRPIEGALADLLAHAREAINDRRAPQSPLLADPAEPPPDGEMGPALVALDVPSGLNSDTGALDPYTLPADLTVTLAAPKLGHVLLPGAEFVGRLLVADIGIAGEHFPEVELRLAEPALVAGWLPDRPASAHKGTFGKALIAAGSANYTGAAYLAAAAATRVGAGLVTLALPEPLHPIVAARLAEATYLLLPHDMGVIAPDAVGLLREKAGNYTALLLGPGLGQEKPTAEFLHSFLAQGEGGKSGERRAGFRVGGDAPAAGPGERGLPPLVIDADGLNLLARQEQWWASLPGECILTPHPGEMARLMGGKVRAVEADRLGVARQSARTWGQTVVLKGAHTVVAAPDGRVVVMPFANPALATAGSGDVLAGAIVGLRAQGLPPFEAAAAGAYLHGLAGEIARAELGQAGVVAGDLVGLLPLAIREVLGG
ncbi:MAG: NAD(P)H-hydrate dehydratase [Anaerolineae bacterium]